MENSEFESIRPYSDEEACAAFARISRNPTMAVISKYLFPNERLDYLSRMISSVQSVDEFQDVVMINVVSAILAKTSEGFTCHGVENLKSVKGKFLAISNHRDIVLDPALIQYAMKDAGIPYTNICVGSNLVTNKLIEDLMRSNRMVKVIRGIQARELYLSSQILSKYIRNSITSGEASVWIAQKEGRAKNGLDVTEQGLLKMFDMSGEGTFEQNFNELNIVPMSISYEYESCDAKKAREVYIRNTTQKYEKRRNEDLHSIMTGIRQQKGHIHLEIDKPLTFQEIADAAACKGNDRYKGIRDILTERIQKGYKLWKTNYMGYDLMNGTSKYLGLKYLPEDLQQFLAYTDHKLSKIESRLDKNAVRDIFWHIYGNPVKE